MIKASNQRSHRQGNSGERRSKLRGTLPDRLLQAYLQRRVLQIVLLVLLWITSLIVAYLGHLLDPTQKLSIWPQIVAQSSTLSQTGKEGSDGYTQP